MVYPSIVSNPFAILSIQCLPYPYFCHVTYELHGKNMDRKDIEWRGWQMDLRQYLDKPCDRKVIWVVGNDGNEGKSFFQENIREEFWYSRVCTLELSENPRNTFHILGKLCSTNTDIFLFNVARAEFLDLGQYKIKIYLYL